VVVGFDERTGNARFLFNNNIAGFKIELQH
jgi:hypothetical protein